MLRVLLSLGLVSCVFAWGQEADGMLAQVRAAFLAQDKLPDAVTRCILYEKILVHVPWLNAELDQRRDASHYASLREECEYRRLKAALTRMNTTEPEVPATADVGTDRDIYIGEAFLYDWDGRVHVRTANGKRFIFSTANWKVQDWREPVSPVEAIKQLAHDINAEP